MQSSLEQQSAKAMAQGSKSFALASLLFRPRMKRHAHMLYAWCRHCDDVIDGQNLGFGEDSAAGRADTPHQDDLATLWEETERVYRGEEPESWPFQAFRTVVMETGLPSQHAFDLLRGFEMDVAQKSYDSLEDTLRYSYHVAGVVGVMMAIVMGVDPQDDGTLDRASDLGIAFQLTNICRDVIDDALIGRVYLPGDWLREAGVTPRPEEVASLANR
ncbi:MAG: phytoene/squalene synthase family protein, partial [Parvularcula sp.]|nr:phytoene/squalene synthase family protein [Parvularcula sp.]